MMFVLTSYRPAVAYPYPPPKRAGQGKGSALAYRTSTNWENKQTKTTKMCFYVLPVLESFRLTFFYYYYYYVGLGHVQDGQISFIHTEFLHLTCPSVLQSPLDPSALLHSPSLREAIKCFGHDLFTPSAS